MRRLLILLSLSIFIIGCTHGGSKPSETPSKVKIHKKSPIEVKAIYFAPTQEGILNFKELREHPEIIVVKTAKDLVRETNKPVSIWIDKNAVKNIDVKWLYTVQNKCYPIILIGYNNALYSFREVLWFGIHGPRVDWSKYKLEPGFSVWKLNKSTNNERVAYLKGYNKPPKVDDILFVSNKLLNGEKPPELKS